MALRVQSLTREFAKHRKKAAVLAVLFAVLLTLSVKAYFDLNPARSAAAVSNITPEAGPATPESGQDADARIRESKELWRTLREVRGVNANIAFTFDCAQYTLDPSRIRVTPSVDAEPAGPKTVAIDPEALQRAHIAAIQAQARGLIVRSTIMGTRPVAIVNQQLLSLGDRILGFELTAIRAREVEFSKDGVTFAVKLDEPR